MGIVMPQPISALEAPAQGLDDCQCNGASPLHAHARSHRNQRHGLRRVQGLLREGARAPRHPGRIGGALLELTPKPLNGCKMFKTRFGEGAIRLMSAPERRPLNLRRIYLRVVEAGDVRPGDPVKVVARGSRTMGAEARSTRRHRGLAAAGLRAEPGALLGAPPEVPGDKFPTDGGRAPR